ncbi:MAG: relaxase [Bacteroidetes bacterium 46-16]|nr:MAG: relaxase [Bacteroidetes bacterium 46-16]
MVAVIKAGHSMHRIFNYNENKVKEGVAECIGAENYPLNAGEMSLSIKLNYLLKRMALNENVKRNSVHISLNFDPSEIGLPKEKLTEIAKTYMQKLGFGDQPYLVYQHRDAGHPHIHLVTTNIQADGRRIDLHHLGIRKSEPARKEIEKQFGLVVAQGRQTKQPYELEPIVMSKIHYGKLQSKKAIRNVLEGVLNTYKFTSLPELNAVLRQYNVLADCGSENSRIFKGGGLVYRILDDIGNPIGVPIKASDFYNKPTLKFLEDIYGPNQAKRMPFKARIKNEIEKAFIGKPLALDELIKKLEKQGIQTALRKSESGLLYGITYVDHQTKCVFNGSALGKQYSAKAIQERCQSRDEIYAALLPQAKLKPADIGEPLQAKTPPMPETSHESNIIPLKADEQSLLDILMKPEQLADYIPGQLKKKGKKKRKRKNISNNQ